MESSNFYEIIQCSTCPYGKKVVPKLLWEIDIGDESDEKNNKPLTRLNSCKPLKMSIVESEGEDRTLSSSEG